MSSFYTRDKIKIIPITKTPGTGELKKGKSFTVKVMVEDETTMISGGSGRGVQSDLYIFAPAKTVIKKGDIIQVVERFGASVDEPERTVIKVATEGSFRESHKDVFA